MLHYPFETKIAIQHTASATPSGRSSWRSLIRRYSRPQQLLSIPLIPLPLLLLLLLLFALCSLLVACLLMFTLLSLILSHFSWGVGRVAGDSPFTPLHITATLAIVLLLFLCYCFLSAYRLHLIFDAH